MTFHPIFLSAYISKGGGLDKHLKIILHGLSHQRILQSGRTEELDPNTGGGLYKNF